VRGHDDPPESRPLWRGLLMRANPFRRCVRCRRKVPSVRKTIRSSLDFLLVGLPILSSSLCVWGCLRSVCRKVSAGAGQGDLRPPRLAGLFMRNTDGSTRYSPPNPIRSSLSSREESLQGQRRRFTR
jgi:hypothetical protein